MTSHYKNRPQKQRTQKNKEMYRNKKCILHKNTRKSLDCKQNISAKLTEFVEKEKKIILFT